MAGIAERLNDAGPAIPHPRTEISAQAELEFWRDFLSKAGFLDEDSTRTRA